MHKYIKYFLETVLKNINILLKDANISELHSDLSIIIIKIIKQDPIIDKNKILQILFKELYNTKLELYTKNDYIILNNKLQLYISKISSNKTDQNVMIYEEIIYYKNIIYYFINVNDNYKLTNTLLKCCFARLISLILYQIILKFINDSMEIFNYISENKNLNSTKGISKLIELRFILLNLLQYRLIPNIMKAYSKNDKHILYIYDQLNYKKAWYKLDPQLDIKNIPILNSVGGAEVIKEDRDSINIIIEKLKKLKSTDKNYENNPDIDEFIIFLSNPFMQKSILVDNLLLPKKFKLILDKLINEKEEQSGSLILNIFNELINTPFGNKLLKIYNCPNKATDKVKNIIYDLSSDDKNTTNNKKSNFEFTDSDFDKITILMIIDAVKSVIHNNYPQSNSMQVNINHPTSEIKINDEIIKIN
jgi:hypothetical protein